MCPFFVQICLAKCVKIRHFGTLCCGEFFAAGKPPRPRKPLTWPCLPIMNPEGLHLMNHEINKHAQNEWSLALKAMLTMISGMVAHLDEAAVPILAENTY